MSDGYELEKTCNHDCFCKYRAMGPIGWICGFTGYCDFSAPRDSRSYSYSSDNACEPCTCGTSAPCKQHPKARY